MHSLTTSAVWNKVSDCFGDMTDCHGEENVIVFWNRLLGNVKPSLTFNGRRGFHECAAFSCSSFIFKMAFGVFSKTV